MSVDLNKIKVGDEVVVRGVVDRLDKGALYRRVSVQFPAYTCGFWIPGEAVVSHTPKALAAGDRVRLYTGGCGFVRAVVGDRAWVDMVDDPAEMLNGFPYSIHSLERVND